MSINTSITGQWPIFVIQGLIAIIFAAVAWFSPQATIGALIFVFAAFFMFDGCSRVWLAFKQKQYSSYWHLTLIAGILGILAAIVTVSMPQLTALIMLYLIAFWAIAIGMMEMAAAIKLFKHLQGVTLLLLSGVVSIIFGIYLIINPGQGIIAMLWLVAIYAFAFGIILCWLGFKLRALDKAQA